MTEDLPSAPSSTNNPTAIRLRAVSLKSPEISLLFDILTHEGNEKPTTWI